MLSSRLGRPNHVAVVNQKTYEPMSSVLVARRVWQMASTPDEKMLFATNGISNDVSVIDVPTLKAIKSIQGRALSMGLGDQAASRC